MDLIVRERTTFAKSAPLQGRFSFHQSRLQESPAINNDCVDRSLNEKESQIALDNLHFCGEIPYRLVKALTRWEAFL
ncbi:MAG: hypothetical protein WC112_06370, partial [Proteiniphilum sp.]